jgi:hypothetical protein
MTQAAPAATTITPPSVAEALVALPSESIRNPGSWVSVEELIVVSVRPAPWHQELYV